MTPRGVPNGLDEVTSQRVLRTFLVVRIVRGTVFLLFLAVAVAGVELRGWPTGVAVALGSAMSVQAVALVAWCRKVRRTSIPPQSR